MKKIIQSVKAWADNRGYDLRVLIASLVVLGAPIASAFIPGNAIYEAPEGNKIAGFALGFCAVVAFVVGDAVFGPKRQEKYWRYFFAAWLAVVIILAILSFSLLVLHGGPLGLNGKTV